MQGLHAGQDRGGARGAGPRPGPDGVGVRGRVDDGPAGAVADVGGGGARGGGQVDDGAPGQERAVLLAQDRAAAQRDDALRARLGAQHGAQGAGLAVAEGLLALPGEDLGDGHPGPAADLGVGVGRLDP